MLLQLKWNMYLMICMVCCNLNIQYFVSAKNICSTATSHDMGANIHTYSNFLLTMCFASIISCHPPSATNTVLFLHNNYLKHVLYTGIERHMLAYLTHIEQIFKVSSLTPLLSRFLNFENCKLYSVTYYFLTNIYDLKTESVSGYFAKGATGFRV